MKPRILLAKCLIKLGRFIQALAVTVMKPDDLIEFSRQSYAKNHEVEAWSQKEWIESGLTPEEIRLVNEIPIDNGNLFILGTGGGREAIFFAQKGIHVTAIDFVPEMVEETLKNARIFGVKIDAFTQEISNINASKNFFDFIWISMGLYSAVPTRKRRINMLKQLYISLKPGGHLFCMFHWDPNIGKASVGEYARKMTAFLTLNCFYEKGNILWGYSEFLHAFTSEIMLKKEFIEGGFEIRSIHLNEYTKRAGAILIKPL